ADRLGSTQFVTDEAGTVYQHLEYFPSGEVWVDERSETQRTPHLFSGKELDEESGLSYFGYRYYDARQGQWISADPILDRMLATGRLARSDLSGAPFHLPGQMYGYVANSPTNLVDPDGLTFLRTVQFFLQHRSFGSAFSRQYSTSTGPGSGSTLWAYLDRRAKEIHSLVVSEWTRSATTISVSKATRKGKDVYLVASSEPNLRPVQRDALIEGKEIAVKGAKGVHAEKKNHDYARDNNINIEATGASRPICDGCAEVIKSDGAAPATVLKAKKPTKNRK
ncbi:MAG TPA: RHS repeat-associated core domain-containing protein, partial [Vicinamibacterales bacterium]|nr:RHS repeat-associated core domain-containing protein [Vicinamibacterales bacterium]